MLGLFSSAAGLLSGSGSSGGLNQASDLLSGGGDQSKSSAQAGDWKGGDLNITREDTTLKYALIIAGIVLAVAVFRKGGK